MKRNESADSKMFQNEYLSGLHLIQPATMRAWRVRNGRSSGGRNSKAKRGAFTFRSCALAKLTEQRVGLRL